jgi:hypothetical protein
MALDPCGFLNPKGYKPRIICIIIKMERSPVPYVLFKAYTPELKYPKEKMQSFFDSVKELDPFIKHYSFMTQGCPKTHRTHFTVVFEFKQSLEEFNISEESMQMWKLTSVMDDVLQRKTHEIWKYGATMYMGIPPIQRAIPPHILKDLVDDLSNYHVDGTPSCYKYEPAAN